MEKNFDDKGYGGAVLMDLSKAFDTLNHGLLIAKLSAYGFEYDALKFIYSYLQADGTERKLTQHLVHGKN